ncbi:acyl-CoA dehydrogenase family protein [Emcibacter sp.]|uniref:acyl-CoA dehydrogenase family protein n=1 Tax=Emcibacter sp. TaxID=1979954 RepID=UPI002AA8DE11|nr:acyl-CoA dehydrogenase family protein [Emcibacter sp.]
MEFLFTQDQLDFQEAVKIFLAGECDVAHLRQMVEKGETFSPDRWRQLAEMGLMGLMLPEEVGGLDLTIRDYILIAEECGYAALPEPLLETAVVTAPLLAEVGGQKELLNKVCSGEAMIVLADSRMPVVTYGDKAKVVLSFDGQAIRLDDSPALQASESIDPLRSVFLYESKGITISEGENAVKLWWSALDRASLIAAAQLYGLGRRMVDMAVAYANDRHQFGKPIGSFQAVKHHLSSVMVALEFARPLIHRAAFSMTDSDPLAGLHVAQAKLRAGEAALQAAESAHQVHGAMGYTYEVDLHLWMKRVWALNAAAGDLLALEDQLEKTVLDGDLPLGPGATFGAA